VFKPNLVFCFGPNQALGLGMGLGPSRTKKGGEIDYIFLNRDLNFFLVEPFIWSLDPNFVRQISNLLS
jgi:hypothetical protein